MFSGNLLCVSETKVGLACSVRRPNMTALVSVAASKIVVQRGVLLCSNVMCRVDLLSKLIRARCWDLDDKECWDFAGDSNRVTWDGEVRMSRCEGVAARHW